MALIKRLTKGSPLTASEMDTNLDFLQSQITAGSSGTSGTSGVTGTSGAAGSDGTSGTSGTSGITGDLFT